MTVADIRQKLYDYIRVAEDRKIKAIYTMLETEIEEPKDNYWSDDKFMEILEQRSEDFKSGKIHAVSWEDAKNNIIKSSLSK